MTTEEDDAPTPFEDLPADVREQFRVAAIENVDLSWSKRMIELEASNNDHRGQNEELQKKLDHLTADYQTLTGKCAGYYNIICDVLERKVYHPGDY